MFPNSYTSIREELIFNKKNQRQSLKNNFLGNLEIGNELFQVVFSFAIRRIVLNYFLPFMFPRRSRVRLIQFYNKVNENNQIINPGISVSVSGEPREASERSES